jgi:3,4-dihydroxy 2-butanone 4-phosphate synthase
MTAKEIDSKSSVGKALEAMKKGKIVCVFDSDDREGETDLTIASQFVTPKTILILRKDGGGLICTTVDPTTRRLLGLPYLTDLQEQCKKEYPVLGEIKANDIPYDSKSSFSITINHRKTFTGITDNDRALTVKAFAEFLGDDSFTKAKDARKAFGKMFRSPGHIHLLNANDGLVSKRQGHSELCSSLALMAGLIPSVTICEMMADTGKALVKAKAKAYAKKNGLVFVEGKEIIEAWKIWSK